MNVKEIPGGYGLPFLGAIKDRLDFYYLQGEVEYFKSRAKKYKSTVYRVNFVPGPPGYPNPRGVALLDQKSFPVLFDNSKVDKKDVFVGPFKPSDEFTGGIRTLAYLDTREERHSVLKEYVFEVMKANGPKFLPEFDRALDSAFDKVDSEIGKSGSYELLSVLEQMAFEFMARSIVHGDPSELPDGASTIKTWIGVQFAAISPSGVSGLPWPLEDLIMRNFPLPSLLVKGSYEKIVDFFSKNATEMIELGQNRFGLGREETLHNLIFVVAVNGWLGFSKLLPASIHFIGSMSQEQQLQLGEEVRSVMKAHSYKFMAAVDKMELLKSTALEILRFSPPVLYQYGRARYDFEVESHNQKFVVKKGELLGGSQALVCRDPAVFDQPDMFMPDRFVGDDDEKLAACVYWSNGRNTDSTSANNKQCGGKDFVETIGRYFIAQLFLRYETIEVSPSSKPDSPVLKSLKKARVAV